MKYPLYKQRTNVHITFKKSLPDLNKVFHSKFPSKYSNSRAFFPKKESNEVLSSPLLYFRRKKIRLAFIFLQAFQNLPTNQQMLPACLPACLPAAPVLGGCLPASQPCLTICRNWLSVGLKKKRNRGKKKKKKKEKDRIPQGSNKLAPLLLRYSLPDLLGCLPGPPAVCLAGCLALFVEKHNIAKK